MVPQRNVTRSTLRWLPLLCFTDEPIWRLTDMQYTRAFKLTLLNRGRLNLRFKNKFSKMFKFLTDDCVSDHNERS